MVWYNCSIPKIFIGTAISPTYAKIESDITTAFLKALWEWLSDSRSQKAYGNGILWQIMPTESNIIMTLLKYLKQDGSKSNVCVRNVIDQSILNVLM